MDLTTTTKEPTMDTTGTIPAATFARYALLTVDEHYAMQARAYREAARAWGDYRLCRNPELRPILMAAVMSADAFYEEVTLALRARTRPELVACPDCGQPGAYGCCEASAQAAAERR